MIFVITMMYEIKEDNWRKCIYYLPDLLGWPDLARRVNSHHVRGCLFAILTWQEKYFMRIWAFSWKFTYMFLQIVEIETWLIQQLSRLSRPRLLETGPKLSRSRFFRDSHWSVSWNIFLLLLDKIQTFKPCCKSPKNTLFYFCLFS